MSALQTAPGSPAVGHAATLGDVRIRQILRLRVPVIIQLAQRRMSVGKIRGFSVGAILEFAKSVDDPLELLINNRCIARGMCVKVAENFGLRIDEIGTPEQRMQSLRG